MKPLQRNYVEGVGFLFRRQLRSMIEYAQATKKKPDPISFALLTGLALLCAAHPAAAQQSPMRDIAADVGIDQRLNAQLPLDLVFTDEHGERKQLREYFGTKPVILECVYFRCPMLCTQVLNGVLKTTNAMSLQMGEDYTVLSISIDPRETAALAAEKKKTYVRGYRRAGAEENWHFLTGDAESIAKLTRAVGFRYPAFVGWNQSVVSRSGSTSCFTRKAGTYRL